MKRCYPDRSSLFSRPPQIGAMQFAATIMITPTQDILASLFVGLASFGALVAGLLFIFQKVAWLSLRPLGPYLKFVIEAVQFLASIAGAFSALAPAEEKTHWFKPIAWGAFCLFIGRGLLLLIERREKQEAANSLAAAEAYSRIIDGLSSCLSQVRRVLADKSSSGSLQSTAEQVKAALGDGTTIVPLLETMAIALRDSLSHGDASANVRAGLYIARDDWMIPVQGVNLKDTTYNPFTSYKAHQLSYQCYQCKDSQSSKPSHVVLCHKYRESLIVPDCAQASKKKKFHYTYDDQANYLKSLYVYYMGPVFDPTSGEQTCAVIAIDSNKPGLFAESSKVMIEAIVREFALRIGFDLEVQPLLRRGVGS